MYLLRHEVLANRRKVINFLKQPKRIKATGALDIGDGARCCLGHMCYVLGVPRNKTNNGSDVRWQYGKSLSSGYAPRETIEQLGLFNQSGRLITDNIIQIKNYNWQTSLADLNDSTSVTPQEIGEYLESVIEGGDHTPWQLLTNYPEQ